jgi:DNA-binding transcriptional LysR family regulator
VNLRQIEAFRAAMTAGSFTGAGAMLNISQPAITRLIGDLERQTGLRLFDRRGGRVTPTPEAEGLYAEVERSFVGLGKIAETAREIRDFRSARLHVAAMPALCLDLLPETVGDFLRTFPNVQVTAQARSSQRIASWIQNQRFDIGLVGPPYDIGGLRSLLTVRAPCLCALPEGHRLAAQETVQASDLDGEAMIVFTEDQQLRHQIERTLSVAGARPVSRVETPLSLVACRMVQEGAGVAVVEPFTARHYDGAGIVVKRLEPTPLFEFAAVAPMHRPPPRTAEAFIDMLRARLSAFSLPAGVDLTIG